MVMEEPEHCKNIFFTNLKHIIVTSVLKIIYSVPWLS